MKKITQLLVCVLVCFAVLVVVGCTERCPTCGSMPAPGRLTNQERRETGLCCKSAKWYVENILEPTETDLLKTRLYLLEHSSDTERVSPVFRKEPAWEAKQIARLLSQRTDTAVTAIGDPADSDNADNADTSF